MKWKKFLVLLHNYCNWIPEIGQNKGLYTIIFLNWCAKLKNVTDKVNLQEKTSWKKVKFKFKDQTLFWKFGSSSFVGHAEAFSRVSDSVVVTNDLPLNFVSVCI